MDYDRLIALLVAERESVEHILLEGMCDDIAMYKLYIGHLRAFDIALEMVHRAQREDEGFDDSGE